MTFQLGKLITAILGLAMILTCAPSVDAQEASFEQRKRSQAFFRAVRQQVDESLFVRTQNSGHLEISHDAPVRWAEAPENYGSVRIWTYRKRPELFATFTQVIAPQKKPLQAHYTAIGESPISCSRSGRKTWQTTSKSTKFARVPFTADPDESRTRRVAAMPKMARGFSVQLEGRRGTKSLKLKTTPLYRYDAPDAGAINGAIFGFFDGEKPAALLIIEARDAGAGKAWYYSFARHSQERLVGRHRNRQVWTAQALSEDDVNKHRQPYTIFTGGGV
ncbi:MAG TPA: hypothetical protein DCY79_01160 [Planctomycetaceae bacterium]|nr:hypothetical protein [Blastopirellula sp.]HAY78394.1 hypothetical protein [Planctomycetaceae bacterium]|tara:strand:- start:97 stop:924 length:828 start_codon:yes stop_codon:yes gene_type:complete